MEAFVEQAATYERCLEKINKKYGPNVTITRREIQEKEYFLGLIKKDIIKLTFNIQDKSDSSIVPNYNHKETQHVNIKKTKFIPPDEDASRELLLKKYPLKTEDGKESIANYENGLKSAQKDGPKTNICSTMSNEDLRKMANTVEKLAEEIAKKTGTSFEHENIAKIAEILENNDFTPKYIRFIKNKIRENLSLLQLDDFDFLQKQVIDWIADAIIIKPFEFDGVTKGNIISLVGPTGIGKTTTLAKIAAYYAVEVSKKVDRALNVQVITSDVYRIGATFQIKRYCELMDMPLAIAETPNDLHKYLDLYKDSKDIICIDTTGRSPSDYAKILEMQRYFEIIDKNLADTHLVISAVSKATDIKEIISQYKGFEYTSLIITKLDETVNIGSIISILDEYKIPLAFVTMGQVVPKDLRVASKRIFIDKLTGFNIDLAYIEDHFGKDIAPSWEKKF